MGEGVNVMDDRRIIGLFLERSEQAIDALSTKYGDLCHHIARNIVGNDQDADECVSDAYLALWDSIPPEKPQFLRAYVTKVLRNIAYDRLDRRTAQMRDARLEVCLEELAECLPGDQSEQAMLDSILIREVLDDFLRTLGKTDRFLFIRRYYCLDTCRQIGKLAGMRESAVSTRLARLRAKLKESLEKEGICV
jgi:RNA polymerase sigma-70 factor (ECF subfamily)